MGKKVSCHSAVHAASVGFKGGENAGEGAYPAPVGITKGIGVVVSQHRSKKAEYKKKNEKESIINPVNCFISAFWNYYLRSLKRAVIWSSSARDVPFPGFFCAGNLLFLWRPPGADAIMKK